MIGYYFTYTSSFTTQLEEQAERLRHLPYNSWQRKALRKALSLSREADLNMTLQLKKAA